MINFIETVHGGQANRLLQSVLADLNEPIYLSGCRALGLIDKVVSGPLWRKLRESSVTMLEMSDVYCRLKAKFDSWSSDAHEVLEGNAVLGDGFIVHLDQVWDALVSPCTELDTMTLELLQRHNGYSLTIYLEANIIQR